MSLTRSLIHHLLNIPGWQTKRKIVVFESDDWGSVRMPSRRSFDALLKKGVAVDKCPYNSNDGLESNQDLECLYDALHSVKDLHGRPAVFTANTIVANPDFEKIQKEGFQHYFYETLPETLKKYPGRDRVFGLYREGIKAGIFIPQFHGREHVNIDRWMRALKNASEETMLAFDEGVFGISQSITKEARKNFMPALDFDNEAERRLKTDIVKDGLRIFQDLFGYNSRSFIAPSYTWDSELEKELEDLIFYFQGITFQKQPVIGNQKYRKRYHFTGQRNSFGQIYMVRNAFFEPSLSPQKGWVENCLNRIAVAFRWGKPAIVGTHRVNFMGNISKKNQDINVAMLKDLLKSIVRRWPETEFMSSDRLGEIIASK